MCLQSSLPSGNHYSGGGNYGNKKISVGNDDDDIQHQQQQQQKQQQQNQQKQTQSTCRDRNDMSLVTSYR